MLKQAKRLVLQWLGYKIVVVSPEFKQSIVHYSWTMTDALEWAACYDNTDTVAVGRFNKVLSYRQGV